MTLTGGGVERDPSDCKVSSATRAFEVEDEQVFAGAGRGPTPVEAEAAERHGPVSRTVAQHYDEMVFRGANQQGEGSVRP